MSVNPHIYATPLHKCIHTAIVDLSPNIFCDPLLDDVSTDRDGYSCLPREKSIGRTHNYQSKSIS